MNGRATAKVVVFAVGNPSRGDDAIGSELARRLADWLQEAEQGEVIEVIEDFQLQIEHALDLAGRDLALFIDAGINTPAPYVFRQIAVAADSSHTTHALSPEAVLEVYRRTEADAPPPAFVLCVRGESFELGEPLSVAAEAHVTKALELLAGLCREASLDRWKKQAA